MLGLAPYAAVFEIHDTQTLPSPTFVFTTDSAVASAS
jgi:hypothetical protein